MPGARGGQGGCAWGAAGDAVVRRENAAGSADAVGVGRIRVGDGGPAGKPRVPTVRRHEGLPARGALGARGHRVEVDVGGGGAERVGHIAHVGAHGPVGDGHVEDEGGRGGPVQVAGGHGEAAGGGVVGVVGHLAADPVGAGDRGGARHGLEAHGEPVGHDHVVPGGLCGDVLHLDGVAHRVAHPGGAVVPAQVVGGLGDAHVGLGPVAGEPGAGRQHGGHVGVARRGRGDELVLQVGPGGAGHEGCAGHGVGDRVLGPVGVVGVGVLALPLVGGRLAQGGAGDGRGGGVGAVGRDRHHLDVEGQAGALAAVEVAGVDGDDAGLGVVGAVGHLVDGAAGIGEADGPRLGPHALGEGHLDHGVRQLRVGRPVGGGGRHAEHVAHEDAVVVVLLAVLDMPHLDRGEDVGGHGVLGQDGGGLGHRRLPGLGVAPADDHDVLLGERRDRHRLLAGVEVGLVLAVATAATGQVGDLGEPAVVARPVPEALVDPHRGAEAHRGGLAAVDGAHPLGERGPLVGEVRRVDVGPGQGVPVEALVESVGTEVGALVGSRGVVGADLHRVVVEL